MNIIIKKREKCGLISEATTKKKIRIDRVTKRRKKEVMIGEISETLRQR